LVKGSIWKYLNTYREVFVTRLQATLNLLAL